MATVLFTPPNSPAANGSSVAPTSAGGATVLGGPSGPVSQPSQPSPSLLSQAGSAFMGGIKKIGTSISQGDSNIQQGVQQASDKNLPIGTAAKGLGKVALGVAQAGFGTVAGAAQAAFSPVSPLISSASSNLMTQLQPTIDKAKSEHPEAADKIDSITQKAQTLMAQHPEATGLINDMVNDALLAVGAKVTDDVAPAVKGAVKGAVSKAGDYMAEKAAVKSIGSDEAKTSVVQEMISPKVDAKATKLALKEGRIAPGQDPTLLKDGTKDQILPSKSTEKAAQTVRRNIPNAHEMKQPDLHAAIGAKIKDMATKLKPEMAKVPITKEVVGKITDAWNDLKGKQIGNMYMDPSIDFAKMQKNFEENFLQKSKSSNLGDLWDTRMAYDDSIPQNVKDATSLSSDRLQDLKSMWLQNRGILNDAINDASTGLGDVSKKAFSDMSDMYNAQRGIESSYKTQEGLPSKLAEFGKTNTGKFIRDVAIGGSVVEAGKKLLTGQF